MNIKSFAPVFSAASLFLAASLTYTTAYADDLPYDPRLSLTGSGGDHLLGKADMMVPVTGDEGSLLYADAQGQYGDDKNWTGSAGIGFRMLAQADYILGAYVFADYNKIDNESHFLFISPGVEAIGLQWDAHLNAYLPVSDKISKLGQDFGDNLGIPDHVSFGPHEQYDDIFSIVNSVGPGVDADIGYQWLQEFPLKTYIGGYHFNPKVGNAINGARLKLVYAVNHNVAAFAEDTYDNVSHNTFMLGLRYTLGGQPLDNQPEEITDRMLDPVDRNLANISKGNTVPVTRGYYDEQQSVLERSNIYFYSSTGGTPFNAANGAANCTYAEPCSGPSFNQESINAINSFAPNANFYLNSGNYNSYASGGASGLSINNGQSIYGRNSDYTLAASGNSRPVLTGELILSGNNTVDSIQLYRGSTDLITAVDARNASNITLNNVAIGDSALAQATSYEIGLWLSQSRNITLSNSQINLISGETGSSEIAGVYLQDNSSPANQASTLLIQNSSINVEGRNPGGGIVAYGILDRGGSLTVNDSQVSVNVNDATTTGSLLASVRLSDGALLNANNDTFSIRSNASGITNIYGIELAGGSTANISNSTITTTSLTSANATDVYLSGSTDTINFSGTNTLNAVSAFGLARIVSNSSGGTFNPGGSTTCILNGITVSCT